MDSDKLRTCVHCGLCLEACPTYRVLKNEADSPRGRIALMRAVSEKRIPMTETVHQHLDACLDCRACETACPAGVPYGELIEEARSEFYPVLQDFNKKTKITRFLLNSVLASPIELKRLEKFLRFYQKSGLQALVRGLGILRWFPEWMERGDALLPPLPKPIFRNVTYFSDNPSARVAFLRGCIGSILFPQVEEAALKLMTVLKCHVEIPENQRCCGALLVHGGFKDDAKTLAQKNVEAFSPEKFDYIVTTAAGCGSNLKEYHHLLPENPQSEIFSKKVLDITELVVRLGLPSGIAPFPHRVAYQDACHLAHAQRIRKEPRQILEAIPQLELIDPPQHDWCCGSAGIYNITHPEMADKLLDEKIKSLLSVNPEAIAVANPGCALQIRMGLQKVKSKIPIFHPIELLARGLMVQSPKEPKTTFHSRTPN